MNFADFDDPVKNECEEKDPQCVAEYLIKLGIHTRNDNRVCIDINSL